MSINIKPTSSYMSLDSWILANILQLATFTFCRRFLNHTNDPGGRMFDQMTQAARSIQANIAEGSARHQTSTETEIKLLDVARASASELASDYMFILMLRNEASWPNNSDSRKAVYNLSLDRANYKDDFTHEAMTHILKQRDKFAQWTENHDISIASNSLLILCTRIISMLTKLIDKRLQEFKEIGGFTENMTKERIASKREQSEAEGAPKCPKCGATMILQTIKRGARNGQQFWGCSNYPNCNGTRNLK